MKTDQHEILFGTVVNFRKVDGEGRSYGFIRPDGAVGDSSANYHFAALLPGEKPQLWNSDNDVGVMYGDRVSFIPGQDLKGRKQARCVKIVKTETVAAPAYVDPVDAFLETAAPQPAAIVAGLREYADSDEEEELEDLLEDDYSEYDEYDDYESVEKVRKAGRLDD